MGMLKHFRDCSQRQCKHSKLPTAAQYKFTRMKEEPKTGVGTRQLFADLVSSWRFDGIIIDTSSRNVPTIGSHKPHVLHRKDGMHGEQSVKVMGEIKGMRDSDEVGGEFSWEEVGQICDFLQTTLLIQPWRSFVYGYLTDCRRFEIFRASRAHDGIIVFERSGVLMDKAGWEALRKLCSKMTLLWVLKT